MKSAIQPGTHPDAEMLTAFAEQSISEKEREEIVAHLAGCNRCREVVFLAQTAADAEMPVVTASQIETRASGGGWFAGWKLFWIPVAALAGIGGVAVLMHMDRTSAPETRMAQNTPPPQMTDSMAVTKAEAPPPASERAQTSEKAKEIKRGERDAGLDRKRFDGEDKAVAKKDEQAKDADALRAAGPDVSATHGNLVARAKSSPIGGPMQNQIQQQNAELQQNYANEARQSGAAADVANKPAAASREATSVSQTVAVEAAGGIVPASPAPAASPVLAAQLQTENVNLNAKNLAKLKGGNVALPSGLGVLSSVIVGKRTVEIDKGGSVFVSDDAGKSWQPVAAPWTGRATRVSSQPALDAKTGSQNSASTQFVLTTDKPETWVSEDGKQWTLESRGSKQ